MDTSIRHHLKGKALPVRSRRCLALVFNRDWKRMFCICKYYHRLVWQSWNKDIISVVFVQLYTGCHLISDSLENISYRIPGEPKSILILSDKVFKWVRIFSCFCLRAMEMSTKQQKNCKDQHSAAKNIFTICLHDICLCCLWDIGLEDGQVLISSVGIVVTVSDTFLKVT